MYGELKLPWQEQFRSGEKLSGFVRVSANSGGD